MELKKTTLDYIRNRAWECADYYVHLASDGHEPWQYPNIRSRNVYILDPWKGDMDRNPSVENPEKVYGWEKMDLFYAEMAKYDMEHLKDPTFLNHPDTPDGWIYIGDDKVRYALGQPGSYNLIIVGLNPSCATPWKPDPTITRIKKLMENELYDGWIMLNLYPKRTKDPDMLPKTVNRPLADCNQAVIQWINNMFFMGGAYAAWGTNIEKRAYLVDECQYIVDMLQVTSWYARGVTRHGHPRHPLYVPYSQGFEWFPVQDYLWSFM